MRWRKFMLHFAPSRMMTRPLRALFLDHYCEKRQFLRNFFDAVLREEGGKCSRGIGGD